MKLTTETIDALKPDPRKRLEFPDDDEKGLWLRVTPAGAKSWAVRFRIKGERDSKRETLGGYPEINPSAARRMAKATKGKAAQGINVIAARKEAKATTEREKIERFDALAETYFPALAIGTHRDKGRPKNPKELNRDKNVWTNWIQPTFGARLIPSVSRREIFDFVAKMTTISASRGRKCHALISQLYSYAVLKGIVPANIAFGVPVVIPDARERMFDDAEIGKLWHAWEDPRSVGSNQSRAMSLAQQVIAATMQRPGQVFAMKATEIDFDASLWKCPAGNMKKSRTHLVPLSDLALELIERAIREVGNDTHVFASPETGEALRVDASSRAFERMAKRLKIEDGQLYDFRTTATTRLAAAGFPEELVAKVLSHDSDVRRRGSVRHYNMYAYLPEKAEILATWAGMLKNIVADQTNVVRLGGKAA